MNWSHLPPPARAVAVAAEAAVAAARDRDRDVFVATTEVLAAVDGSGLVLGTVVRLLLEERHPDGLDGDDIGRILADCVSAAAGWQVDTDPHVVLVLLAGTLGIHPDDDPAPPGGPETAWHGPLLVAALLAGSDRPLAPYLTAAFTEIARTELYD